MINKIDGYLYSRGFVRPEVRRLVRFQFILTLFASGAGLALCWFYLWPLHFAIGVGLAAFNFYSLAKFIQQIVFMTYSRQILTELLIRFFGRLLLSGLLLYVLIIVVKVSIVALLAGLTSVVATISVWGCAQLGEHKVKEA